MFGGVLARPRRRASMPASSLRPSRNRLPTNRSPGGGSVANVGRAVPMTSQAPASTRTRRLRIEAALIGPIHLLHQCLLGVATLNHRADR